MHITVMAVGSRGDVQPFVALGKGLQGGGHRVRMAAPAVHAGMAQEHGLEFAPIEGNPRELLESRAGQAWLGSGRNPVTFWRQFRKLAERTVEKGLQDAQEACVGTDAVVYTPLGSGGYHVAEAMGIPRILAVLQPFSRTREFPFFLFPPLPPGSAFNRWTYLLAEQMGWRMGSTWVNRWRRDSLGLPKLGPGGPFPGMYARREPFLCGFSETVVPRPGDWPPQHHVAGYWFLDGKDSWSPPPSLLDFLASGHRPVYIGFGSMGGELGRGLLALAVQAVEEAQQRAVLLGGWATDAEEELPEFVYAMGEAPHDWLFPRMAALVHHGGAGTTAAGLRAGVPSVITPFFSDQPFWGRRVHDLGAGPTPLPRKTITSERLASAISEAVSNRDMAARAAAIGEKLRGEDGVGKGVAVIQELLSRG